VVADARGGAVIRLVVTADDVGLDPGITEGALRAWSEGIVTSLSVITARSDWRATIDRLKAAGARDVGVHLTLCEGAPALPPAEVPTLVEADGRFPLRGRTVVARILAGRVDLGEVRKEWLAQVRRAQESGLSVNHLDGHKHLHVLPGLLGVAFDVRQGCGVPGMRLPRQPGPGPRRAVRRVLGLLSGPAASRFRRTGAVTTDRVAGIDVAGRLDTPALVELIGRLQEGTTELVAHPGQPGATLPLRLEAEGLAWAGAYRFADELLALTSDEARAELEGRGVELVGWADLAR